MKITQWLVIALVIPSLAHSMELELSEVQSDQTETYMLFWPIYEELFGITVLKKRDEEIEKLQVLEGNFILSKKFGSFFEAVSGKRFAPGSCYRQYRFDEASEQFLPREEVLFSLTEQGKMQKISDEQAPSQPSRLARFLSCCADQP